MHCHAAGRASAPGSMEPCPVRSCGSSLPDHRPIPSPSTDRLRPRAAPGDACPLCDPGVTGGPGPSTNDPRHVTGGPGRSPLAAVGPLSVRAGDDPRCRRRRSAAAGPDACMYSPPSPPARTSQSDSGPAGPVAAAPANLLPAPALAADPTTPSVPVNDAAAAAWRRSQPPPACRRGTLGGQVGRRRLVGRAQRPGPRCPGQVSP